MRISSQVTITMAPWHRRRSASGSHQVRSAPRRASLPVARTSSSSRADRQGSPLRLSSSEGATLVAKHWNTDQARHTYAIPHWGDGYVDVDAAGHIVMRPRGDGGPALSLPGIVERARSEGLRLPLLVRFPDLLADRLARVWGAVG